MFEDVIHRDDIEFLVQQRAPHSRFLDDLDPIGIGCVFDRLLPEFNPHYGPAVLPHDVEEKTATTPDVQDLSLDGVYFNSFLSVKPPDADHLFNRSVKALPRFGTVDFPRIQLRQVCGGNDGRGLADHALVAIINIVLTTYRLRIFYDDVQYPASADRAGPFHAVITVTRDTLIPYGH